MSNRESRTSSTATISKSMEYGLIILGDSKVGKTSITERFVGGKFHENQLSTVGTDHFTKQMEVNGLNYNLKVYDTAGQERYHCLVKNFYKHADGVLIAYSLAEEDLASKVHVITWLDDFLANKTKENQPIFIIANKYDILEEKSGKSLSEEDIKKDFLDTVNEFFTSDEMRISLNCSDMVGSLKSNSDNGDLSAPDKIKMTIPTNKLQTNISTELISSLPLYICSAKTGLNIDVIFEQILESMIKSLGKQKEQELHSLSRTLSTASSKRRKKNCCSPKV